ncbi:S-layer homology domain-containing protein, partial [Megasphaera sp.]
NPFVDVPSDSWAYKSVVELADAGIIQGVDGQYFQGNRNITRYEAAEMVAKAMAHMDKASVEQRALINKLADEYADELNNLGVRVSALESRVGNVKLTGDARVRYIHQDSDDQGKGEVKNDNSWSYRVRVRANAQVNDRTKVVYGVSTNNVKFADNSTASDSKDNNIFTDRAFVDYNFGGNNWDLKVGRDEYDMGGGRAYGFLYGDTFDGAQLKYTNDKFAATAGYGKFKEGVMGGDNGASAATKTGYGELEGFFGGGRAAGSAVGVYYNDFSGNKSFNFDDAWGAYGSLNLGKWNALANYEKYNSENSKADDPEVWVGKITYNKANFATSKSWDAWVEYLNADNGFGDKTHAFIGSTQSWRNGNLLNNVKSWGVGADYTFAKNAQFQVMQSFASEAKEGNNDPGEETRAQFVFVF